MHNKIADIDFMPCDGHSCCVEHRNALNSGVSGDRTSDACALKCGLTAVARPEPCFHAPAKWCSPAQAAPTTCPLERRDATSLKHSWDSHHLLWIQRWSRMQAAPLAPSLEQRQAVPLKNS